MNQRILGYDFARAFAVFGMVIVNFKLVMTAVKGPEWMIRMTGMLEGRAAAVFVILAGVGISLMTAGARYESNTRLISSHRKTLLKRAFLLVVVGLSYSHIWPADILHFYGFYLVLGVALLNAKNRTLILCSVLLILGFLTLGLFFDYESGWIWETMTYTDFWSLSGMVRRIFFNGFHPVFPWAAFLLMGMWLGRQNMADDAVRRRIMLGALITWGAVEYLSGRAVHFFLANPMGMPHEDIIAVFGTGPIPPMPQYLLSAGGSAVFFISICISITCRFGSAPWVHVLCTTGKMSLTLYAAHVILGMGILETMGRLEYQTMTFALVTAMGFNTLGILFAHAWALKFKTGPLERLFRILAK